MFEPVKQGLYEYIGRFYAGLVPTTKPMHEYVSRGYGLSVSLAPARMIDEAMDMLDRHRRDDRYSQTKAKDMPIILVAISKDYSPTDRAYARQVADRASVILPNDPKCRLFGARTVAGDFRVQLAICTMDEPTAKSIASQFNLFLEGTANSKFETQYAFAGFDTQLDTVVATRKTEFLEVKNETKNATILVGDITVRATAPIFDFPLEGNPNNDGKGTNFDSDPSGYKLLEEINYEHCIYLR